MTNRTLLHFEHYHTIYVALVNVRAFVSNVTYKVTIVKIQ